MPFYKTIPLKIQAVKYDGTADSIMNIIDLFGAAELKDDGLFLKTITGEIKIREGDYLVKNADKSFAYYNADKFELLFELVEENK